MAKVVINITGPQSVMAAIHELKYMDITKPMVMTLAPLTKKRTRDQNSMAWAGMLSDFSRQGFINGRTFAESVWHEYLKQLLLPSTYEEGMTLKGYVKWLEMPDGSMRMVGSTTKLTTKGFSDYLESCYAYGCSELDIKFTANPRDY